MRTRPSSERAVVLGSVRRVCGAGTLPLLCSAARHAPGPVARRAGGSSPIPIAPASSASAASSRAGSPPRSSTMGWPVATRSPGLARQMTPAAARTVQQGRDRPAPRRHEAIPADRASRRRTTRLATRRRFPASGPVRRRAEVTSLGPDHVEELVQGPAAGEGFGGVAADPGQPQHRLGLGDDQVPHVAGAASAQDSRASRTSTALPTARPSGVSMAVIMAAVRTPWASPSRVVVWANCRAWPRSVMNAPSATPGHVPVMSN